MGERLAPVEGGGGVQRSAREGKSTRQEIDGDDLGRGCRWPQHDPPLDFRGQSVLSFGGCVPHRQALQRGVLLRQQAGRLLVREPAPPGRLPGADDPAQRVVRVVSVARVVSTTRARVCTLQDKDIGCASASPAATSVQATNSCIT